MVSTIVRSFSGQSPSGTRANLALLNLPYGVTFDSNNRMTIESLHWWNLSFAMEQMSLHQQFAMEKEAVLQNTCQCQPNYIGQNCRNSTNCANDNQPISGI